MEPTVRTSIIAIGPSDEMNVSYFVVDMPNTQTSGMINLMVRSKNNIIPPLEQAVPANALDNLEMQERLVHDLVRSYLAATNKIPNKDISFEFKGETIAGRLTGSEVWWTFDSRSPAFLEHFPGGMLGYNVFFNEPPSADMQAIFNRIQEHSSSLAWRRP